MTRPRSARGTVMVVVVVLITLAGGLLAVVGSTVAQLVRANRRGSDAAIVRQMVDSGVAWAGQHAGQWPASSGSDW